MSKDLTNNAGARSRDDLLSAAFVYFVTAAGMRCGAEILDGLQEAWLIIENHMRNIGVSEPDRLRVMAIVERAERELLALLDG